MAAKRKASPKTKTKNKKAKPAAKPVTKAAPRKKAAPKKAAAKPAGLVIKTNPALEARLRMLASKMGKSLDALIVQALGEFADNWEDHMQTVAALQDTEGRVQLSVPKE